MSEDSKKSPPPPAAALKKPPTAAVVASAAARKKASPAKKKQQLAKAKAPRKRTTRLEKIRDFMSDISSKLDTRWRSLALACEVENNMFRRNDWFVTFRCGFVQELLAKFEQTPSKIRKTTASSMAQKINQHFQMVTDRGFLTLGFLSEENEFQAKLKTYAAGKISTYKDLVRGECDAKFMELLERNRLVAALVHLLDKDQLGALLLPEDILKETTGDRENSPTAAFARRYMLEGQLTAEDKLSLANNVYSMELEEHVKQQSTEQGSATVEEECLERAFETATIAFQEVQTRLNEYQGWLEGRYQDPTSNRPHLPGRVSWALADAHRHSRYIPVLLARNFARLDRDQHDRYFDWSERPSNRDFF